MARQGRFLSRRQFARPVTTPPTGAHLPGSPPPDQRLVDIRHADPEHRGHRPRRHAAVNGHQNPSPQVLRIALTLPPSHRRPQYLVVWAANHTFPRSGIPFGDSGQCGNALEDLSESVSLFPPLRFLLIGCPTPAQQGQSSLLLTFLKVLP